MLVLGASGFIGAHVAAALAAAGWAVRAGARRPDDGRRRAPALDWVRADFADLTEADAWLPLLEGVDAVVNCVGVLQDGAGDSTAVAHERGPRALIAACEAAGVRRLVHVSAVGADDDAGTPYARSKRATETLLEASSLDWAVVRPSLVVARGVFGGTALIRALAAFPGFIPVVGGDQTFRPVAMADVCEAVVRLLAPGAPARVRLDLAGPQSLTLADLLKAYRGWLGFAPAPLVRVPPVLAAPALAVGDLLGRLGWPSPLRTTSLRQMNHDVGGDAGAAERLLGLRTRSLDQYLSEQAAAVQDRWHARLYFVRPLAIALLAAFWIGTGLVTFGPGWKGAVAILHEGGYGAAAPWIAGGGAVVDIALGLALLLRRFTARAAIGMALVTAGYLVAATLALPQYWLDPLGPWLKTLPGLALCLFVAATDERR
ncbi:SDR family oxidoreductase [Caulobacter sp. 17J80-11]|nr:SDR family oxidoreductase [Caulobacter sp. 17J80-11]